MNRFITLAIASCILTLACTNHIRKEDGRDQLSPKDTFKYTDSTYMLISHFFQQRDESVDTTYFKAYFPVSSDSNFNNLIHQALLLSDEESLEAMAHGFIGDYDEYVEQAENTQQINAWFKKIKVNVTAQTSHLFATKTRVDEYSGGAHGNYFEILHNFDLQNHKKIDLLTLILPDKRKEFLNIAEQNFRKQEGLAENESLKEKYFFDNGRFSLADNFALTKDGLILLYNPYEIKPYVDGITTMSISYSDIDELLSEEGRLFISEIQKNS